MNRNKSHAIYNRVTKNMIKYPAERCGIYETLIRDITCDAQAEGQGGPDQAHFLLTLIDQTLTRRGAELGCGESFLGHVSD